MSLLFYHQKDGAEYLAGRHRAYLADPPRLGKTRTLIAGLQLAGRQAPLVICPAIVRTHWQREFEILGWDRLTPQIYSYEQIVRGDGLLRDRILATGVDSLVLDEAHYLKSMDAERTKLLLGKNGYARRIDVVWAASGTPMPRHPGELWAVLSTLFPGIVLAAGFKTYQQWLDHFCVYAHTQYGIKVFSVKNADELRAILALCVLRRTPEEVGLDAPPLLWSEWTLDVELDNELLLMDRNAEMLSLQTWVEAGGSAAGIVNLNASKYRRLVGEAKAYPVGEQLKHELQGSEDKIVVFAHHRSVLDQLRGSLAPHGVAYVDGEVTGAKRDAAIDRFTKDVDCRVFLGQTIACQTGIDLSVARRVVLVEPDWTNTVNQQAGKRVWGVGARAGHRVAEMVSLAGTLDDAIVKQNVRELRMIEEVLT